MLAEFRQENQYMNQLDYPTKHNQEFELYYPVDVNGKKKQLNSKNNRNGAQNKAIGEMQRKFETRKKKRIEIHLGLLDFFLAWDDSPSLLLSPLVFISTIPSSRIKMPKLPLFCTH